MFSGILLICSPVHQVPVIIYAVMVRGHGNIHDIVLFRHLYIEGYRAFVWRLGHCRSRIYIRSPFSFRSDSVYIHHIFGTWIQSLVLEIFERSLVEYGLKIVL